MSTPKKRPTDLGFGGRTSWDDAKRRALQENKPIAVDVWATWCHTCLSMKHYVLTEPAMKKVANKHVWLAVLYKEMNKPDLGLAAIDDALEVGYAGGG